MQQKLGPYQPETLIGEGTFAFVYRAFDERLQRFVALKVLKPIWLSDPQAVERFKRAASALAQLHHANLVDVYNVGEAEGYIYLVERLIEGQSLAAKLQDGPLTWEETLAILRDVAAGLDYAHAKGLVHRDVKPSNILLDHEGRAYLSDFGLVRAAEGSMTLSQSAGSLVT